MITHFTIDVNQPQREFHHDSRDLLSVFGLRCKKASDFKRNRKLFIFDQAERLISYELRFCFSQKPFAPSVPQHHSVEIVFGMPASYMNGIGEMEKIFETSGRIKYLR